MSQERREHCLKLWPSWGCATSRSPTSNGLCVCLSHGADVGFKSAGRSAEVLGCLGPTEEGPRGKGRTRPRRSPRDAARRRFLVALETTAPFSHLDVRRPRVVNPEKKALFTDQNEEALGTGNSG